MANTEYNQITKGSIRRIGVRIIQGDVHNNQDTRVTTSTYTPIAVTLAANPRPITTVVRDMKIHTMMATIIPQPTVNTDMGILSNVAMDQDTTTMTTN